ncbi:MAG: MBL fold metallo-hydrolase [Spirochaetaceae bacterium]|jgi:glyoxylase-like metal-dependent hydrolase (beta-lactamase superfamily II)|nr:MBL fold metallo-hydrolase [Spirochaetaceae bacterium]
MKKIMLVLTSLAALNCFGEDIFTYKTGDYEICTLVETTGPGRPQVLIGADEALQRRYLAPAGGAPDFQSEINTFLIRGKGRVVLVDTGFGGAVFENMKKLGVNPGDVDVVLLTHLHGDHIGGLAKDGKALFPRALVYLAEQERDYWTKTNVNAGAVAALAPYGNRIRTFKPGELGAAAAELLPGITAIAAFGHTPGHTAFLVVSGNARLLIWGDVMHVQGIQFPRPDISVTYDTDPVRAAEVRKKILDYAAKNNIPVAGMHLLYPAVGTVRPAGDGFSFEPAR